MMVTGPNQVIENLARSIVLKDPLINPILLHFIQVEREKKVKIIYIQYA